MAAEGGRVGCACAKGGVYCFQNTAQISIDIAVPEPHHAKACPRKFLIAAVILGFVRILIVLSAVYLDDQAVLQANKIDNESLPWCLPSKMKAALSPSPEVIPNFHLLRGHRFA